MIQLTYRPLAEFILVGEWDVSVEGRAIRVGLPRGGIQALSDRLPCRAFPIVGAREGNGFVPEDNAQVCAGSDVLTERKEGRRCGKGQ